MLYLEDVDLQRSDSEEWDRREQSRCKVTVKVLLEQGRLDRQFVIDCYGEDLVKEI